MYVRRYYVRSQYSVSKLRAKLINDSDHDAVHDVVTSAMLESIATKQLVYLLSSCVSVWVGFH